MAEDAQGRARLEVRLATTPAEVEACEEVIRVGFGRVMRLGIDPEPEEQRALITLCCVDVDSGRILATSRLVGLDYLERSEKLIEEYRIGHIPPWLRARSLLSFQSAALPDQRGTDVMSLLFRGCFEYAVANDYLFTVSACKPFLFPYFVSMGFRLYESAYISSEGGYRIPILLINHDQDYLRACKSPFANALQTTSTVPGFEDAMRWYAEYGPKDERLNVRILAKPEQIKVDLGFMKGLNEATIRSIFRWAVEITCRAGDHLVKEKSPEHVIGFLLDGSVDVRKGERTVATLKAGEIFGEVGFLLRVPRTASLYAAEDGTRIAFISMHSIDAIKDAAEAAIFWRNLSTHLAARLQNTTELL